MSGTRNKGRGAVPDPPEGAVVEWDTPQGPTRFTVRKVVSNVIAVTDPDGGSVVWTKADYRKGIGTGRVRLVPQGEADRDPDGPAQGGAGEAAEAAEEVPPPGTRPEETDDVADLLDDPRANGGAALDESTSEPTGEAPAVSNDAEGEAAAVAVRVPTLGELIDARKAGPVPTPAEVEAAQAEALQLERENDRARLSEDAFAEKWGAPRSETEPPPPTPIKAAAGIGPDGEDNTDHYHDPDAGEPDDDEEEITLPAEPPAWMSAAEWDELARDAEYLALAVFRKKWGFDLADGIPDERPAKVPTPIRGESITPKKQRPDGADDRAWPAAVAPGGRIDLAKQHAEAVGHETITVIRDESAVTLADVAAAKRGGPPVDETSQPPAPPLSMEDWGIMLDAFGTATERGKTRRDSLLLATSALLASWGELPLSAPTPPASLTGGKGTGPAPGPKGGDDTKGAVRGAAGVKAAPKKAASGGFKVRAKNKETGKVSTIKIHETEADAKKHVADLDTKYSEYFEYTIE